MASRGRGFRGGSSHARGRGGYSRDRDAGGGRSDDAGGSPARGGGRGGSSAALSPREAFYSDYITIDEALTLVREGRLLVGALRINARKRTEAYVPVAGIPVDVFIDGEADRNRSLEGDIVALELMPRSEWTERRTRTDAAATPTVDAAAAAAASGARVVSGKASAATAAAVAADDEAALAADEAAALSQRLWQPAVPVAMRGEGVAYPATPSASPSGGEGAGAGAGARGWMPHRHGGVATPAAGGDDDVATPVDVAGSLPSMQAPARLSAPIAAATATPAYAATVRATAALTGGGRMQPRGRVVAIVSRVHDRQAIGLLRPLDDRAPLSEPISDRTSVVRFVSAGMRRMVTCHHLAHMPITVPVLPHTPRRCRWIRGCLSSWSHAPMCRRRHAASSTALPTTSGASSLPPSTPGPPHTASRLVGGAATATVGSVAAIPMPATPPTHRRPSEGVPGRGWRDCGRGGGAAAGERCA